MKILNGSRSWNRKSLNRRKPFCPPALTCTGASLDESTGRRTSRSPCSGSSRVLCQVVTYLYTSFSTCSVLTTSSCLMENNIYYPDLIFLPFLRLSFFTFLSISPLTCPRLNLLTGNPVSANTQGLLT